MRREGNDEAHWRVLAMPPDVDEQPKEPHEARVVQVAMQVIHGMLRQEVALHVGAESGALLLVLPEVSPTDSKDVVLVVANNRR